MDPLTFTIILSLFNLFIIITSQSSFQHQYHFIICNLYSSPSCGSTPILSSYLLLWHFCTWDKTSIFWSCHVVSLRLESHMKIILSNHILWRSYYTLIKVLSWSHKDKISQGKCFTEITLYISRGFLLVKLMSYMKKST
jgi:hypothetical protein